MAGGANMTHERIIVAGASGLIGSALVESLRRDGVEVLELVRRETQSAFEREWHPERGELDAELLRGAKATVNLGGASIGRLPWTRAYRETLWNSRVQVTRTIAGALSELGSDAPHFVSASAVGYYGDQPGVVLTEAAPAGSTFLARLCVAWEAEARAAHPAAPVALIRTAPILHPDGVLKPLMRLTKLGVSGPLGRGTQIWPWISLADEVRAIRHVIDTRLSGPVNLTGPAPASATDIGRAIAAALHRPYLLPAPAWALRLGLGRDAADGLLLPDARVRPERLLETGFEFTHPTAEAAIASALGHASSR